MFSAQDLGRFMVGQDVGILKIFTGPGTTNARLFTKTNPDLADLAGNDIPENFPESNQDRQAIFAALGIDDPAQIADFLMINYPNQGFPKRNAVALLGSLGGQALAEPVAQRVSQFLAGLLSDPQIPEESDLANITRRQALLALSLLAKVDGPTALKVAQLLDQTDNNFVVTLLERFFSCHQAEVLACAQIAEIRSAIETGKENPVKAQVLALLTPPVANAL